MQQKGEIQMRNHETRMERMERYLERAVRLDIQAHRRERRRRREEIRDLEKRIEQQRAHDRADWLQRTERIERNMESWLNNCWKSVGESLRVLRTDVIDVMMLHSGSSAILAREDVFDTLEELRQTGSIRYIGASVYGMDGARKAIESGRCDCIQLAYSVLDRRPEKGILRLAKQKDVGIVARSVLLKGALTYRYRDLPDELARLRSAVEELKKAAGCADEGLPALAYRWALGRPLIHTALAGASSVGEVEQAVRFAEAGPLPDGTASAVDRVAIEDENILNPATWPIG